MKDMFKKLLLAAVVISGSIDSIHAMHLAAAELQHAMDVAAAEEWLTSELQDVEEHFVGHAYIFDRADKLVNALNEPLPSSPDVAGILGVEQVVVNGKVFDANTLNQIPAESLGDREVGMVRRAKPALSWFGNLKFNVMHSTPVTSLASLFKSTQLKAQAHPKTTLAIATVSLVSIAALVAYVASRYSQTDKHIQEDTESEKDESNLTEDEIALYMLHTHTA